MDKDMWLDIDAVAERGMDWNVFVGARRIGKTYGILKRFMEKSIRFLLVRRTKEELTRAVEEGIFDELNEDLGMEYTVEYAATKGIGVVYKDAEKKEEVGKLFALSIIRSLRGVNYYKYQEMFFDEVIPEEGVRQSDSDGITTVQAFETIFGNRELPPHNLPPMKVWLAMNPIEIFDPILTALNLIEPVMRMATSKQKQYSDPDRSLYIYFGGQKGIADMKRATSLYKMIGANSETSDHILEGTYRGDTLKYLKKRVDMKHYYCLFEIDSKIYVYVDKRDENWYVTRSKAGCDLHFLSSAPFIIRKRFAPRYQLLHGYGMVAYQSADLVQIMDALLG